MVSASLSTLSQPDSLAHPVALVASDLELPNDGLSVVSLCILCKYFGYYGLSCDCLLISHQFPSGDLLPVTAHLSMWE
jgi:hypothetical protein